LVHWLLNRIDGYREEVCDTTVLRRGVAGPTLAEILVDFSRRNAAARPDAAVKPALPFLHRRSVKRRVAELLEEETVLRWSAPLARRQIASLGLLAAAALAGLGSFGLEAADAPASGVDVRHGDFAEQLSILERFADESNRNDMALSAALDWLRQQSHGERVTPTPPRKVAEPGTAGLKTAAESSTLKRILANWKARQDRTRSLHLAWDSQIPLPRDETPEGQQLMRALLELKTADVELRALSRAVELHLPVRRGDGPGAPKNVVPAEQLAKAQARLKAAKADLELARTNEARPKLHPPFRVLHNELWIEGDKRIRIEQSLTRGRGYRYVRDDMTKSMLVWRSESGERPLAKIDSGEGRADLDAFDLGVDFDLQDLVFAATTPRIRTPWMIFRPFGPEGWRPEEFRLVAEDVVVDNAHYVKIGRIPASKSSQETYFVDAARDDVIAFAGDVREEVSVGNEPPIHNNKKFALAIEYQRDRDWSWVPVRWKVNFPANFAPRTSVNTVTGLTINEMFPPETFALNFAPRTVVFDRRTREQYVIADDGSKTNVLRFDSDKSLRIDELLESRTDFTIEPQPLKDALSFLAARYQIAILFDAKAFETRKIASTVEVTCNESGIKLRELLSKLLRQVDKSVDFKIENGVLRIAPVDWIDFNPAKPLTAPKGKDTAK
jgi:hypothetical protein